MAVCAKQPTLVEFFFDLVSKAAMTAITNPEVLLARVVVMKVQRCVAFSVPADFASAAFVCDTCTLEALFGGDFAFVDALAAPRIWFARCVDVEVIT
jgi:hypothetical protein